METKGAAVTSSSTAAAPPVSARGKVATARPDDANTAATMNTARSSAETAAIETGRSYLDTARVQVALAALTAEKNSLMTKLAFIDSALEAESKKKRSLVGRK